jgi:hypothetical protein
MKLIDKTIIMKSVQGLLVATLFSITCVVTVNGQNQDSVANLPNLLFPKFSKGILRLTSGEKKTAILNYNKVDQEMVFMQRDNFWVLDYPQKAIDTIYLAGKTFVPSDKGFFEISVLAPITLFKINKAYIEELGMPTGYGARSQTTAPSYIKTIYGSDGAINLNIPSNYKVVDDSEYALRKDGIISKFKTKKQFIKILPEKAKEINEFISSNHIDFDNLESVKKLVLYCNTIYR